MNENDPKGMKYEFGQLVFWAIVFALVLIGIIILDDIILPLIRGSICG